MTTQPYLKGAAAIREHVIVPFRHVMWKIGFWDDPNIPVFYGDEGALFIYDYTEQCLHSIHHGMYDRTPFTRASRNGPITKIHMAPIPAGRLNLTGLHVLNQDIVEYLFTLAKYHQGMEDELKRFGLRPKTLRLVH